MKSDCKKNRAWLKFHGWATRGQHLRDDANRQAVAFFPRGFAITLFNLAGFLLSENS